MIDVNLIGAPAFAVRIAEGGFVYAGVNARLCEITGLRAADLVGRTPRDCLPAEVAAAVTARYQSCVASRQAADSEMLLEGPSGPRWWRVTITPVLDASGAVESLIGVSTDATDRHIAEQRQRDVEARMALAMDVIDGGFWHLDLATEEVEASPKLALLMTGTPAERMSWADFVSRIHPDDRERFDSARLLTDGIDAATVEYRVRDADRGERWLRSKCHRIREDAAAVDCLIGVVTDVTEHKRVEAFYAREAMSDPLTGLQNRRGFVVSAGRFAEAATRTATVFGLILIDLDGFKPINDRYGHATGDAVLQDIAARLAAQVRPQDVVARVGGDEFAILIADVAEGDLPALAERLLAAARMPMDLPSGHFDVGISLGLAASRVDDRGIDDLAARADAALYAVKSAGRGALQMAA